MTAQPSTDTATAGVAALIAGWRDMLGSLSPGYDSADLLDAAEQMERLKRSMAAAQARLAVQLLEVREEERLRDRAAEEAARGGEPRSVVPPSRATVRRGTIKEFGLASRLSPARATAQMNRAARLVTTLPHTLAGLARGDLSEWAAELIDRATRDLSVPNAARVDAALVEFHATCSERELEARAQQLAMSVEPETVLARAVKAPRERRVSLRPAADGMAALSALVPLRDGVAIKASLSAAARAARADGTDQRSDCQVEADELTERVTGHRAACHETPAESPHDDHSGADEPDCDPEVDSEVAEEKHAAPSEAPSPSRAGPSAACPHCGVIGEPTTRPPIELGLIMTDRALFGHNHDPGNADSALLDGRPLPASLARDLLCDPAVTVHLRRLYTHPTTGQLIAMESHRRLFAGALRAFVATRDQRCRDPFCGAPIRDIDHVRPHSHGGRTSAVNAQGLSVRCHHDKESPGFSARTVPDPVTGDLDTAPAVTLRTPSGREYTSRAPRLIPSLNTAPRPRPDAPTFRVHWQDLGRDPRLE